MSHRKELFTVFGFGSTHDALRAESVLLEQDIGVALIPTPRALGTLCGFAVRVRATQSDTARAVLARCGIDATGSIEVTDRAVT